MKKYRLLVLAAILIFANNLRADDLVLAAITIKEDSGFPRDLEYIECNIQVSNENLDNSQSKFIIEEIHSESQVSCQISEMKKLISQDVVFFKLLFPMSIGASEKNAYLVFKMDKKDNFEAIKYWVDRLHHPLEVKVQYN